MRRAVALVEGGTVGIRSASGVPHPGVDAGKVDMFTNQWRELL
jgi:hypothetical protein